MKCLLIILFAIQIAAAINAQPINQTITAPKDSSEILYGYFTREILTTSRYVVWYQDEYNNYKPDKKTIKTLKRKLPEHMQVFVVMGSWCSDSQRELPRLIKVLDNIGIDQKNITYVAVDHQKKTTHFKIEHLKIDRVPTIIFYNNNREGRIVETPKSSLEKDMLEIVKNIK